MSTKYPMAGDLQARLSSQLVSNPRHKSVLTGPRWDAARLKLQSAAATVRKKNPTDGARNERLVREALAASSTSIARSLDRHPHAVVQADAGACALHRVGVAPGHRTVLVLTEYGIGDPMTYPDVAEAFDRATEHLRRATGQNWMWDSWNSAVQMFRIQEELRIPPHLLRDDLTLNPSNEDRELAVAKYEEFHRYAPKKIGEFAPGFKIPRTMLRAGRNKWVTYRSAKVGPSTLEKPKRPVDYIHEHDAGVDLYVPVGELPDFDLERVSVPREFWDVEALAMLGQSLGYSFEVDGEEIEAVGESPLPELYCVPSGKCLLVIQDKREVLAMIWGGALGVFARGIDG